MTLVGPVIHFMDLAIQLCFATFEINNVKDGECHVEATGYSQCNAPLPYLSKYEAFLNIYTIVVSGYTH